MNATFACHLRRPTAWQDEPLGRHSRRGPSPDEVLRSEDVSGRLPHLNLSCWIGRSSIWIVVASLDSASSRAPKVARALSDRRSILRSPNTKGLDVTDRNLDPIDRDSLTVASRSPDGGKVSPGVRSQSTKRMKRSHRVQPNELSLWIFLSIENETRFVPVDLTIRNGSDPPLRKEDTVGIPGPDLFLFFVRSPNVSSSIIHIF